MPTASAQPPSDSRSSYGQILKSSSIIGGAQGVNYLIAMVRTKAVALLLGPSGVGLVGLYSSATELVGTVAGLGISSSGVRDVAEAHASGDPNRMARTIKTLRRACWVTGFLGWLISAALSYPLSVWAFGSGERAWAIAVLGVTLLLSSVAAGQSAVLQGTRRIGDFARLGIGGAVAGTVVALGLYAWLGERGIVPVMIVTAALNMLLAYWFARKVTVQPVALTWSETVTHSRSLIGLGVAFMYGAVLASLVGLAIRAVILRKYGIEANGIYQAAWALSGMFASFILNAMGTDFYPRLTAVAGDNQQVNRLVNEQIEIGILLALPGMLGTLALAPWVMRIFYSAKFLPSAELLPWLVLGIFGQVITFPLGFIQRAKGKAGWIFVSQSHLNALHVILAVLLIPAYGVVAAAWAFSLTTYIHGLVAFAIARRLSRFAWTRASLGVAASAAAIIAAGFAAPMVTRGVPHLIIGLLLTVLATIISLRGICARLGANHRLVRLALKVPGGRIACGL